jgi:hypothetical protein
MFKAKHPIGSKRYCETPWCNKRFTVTQKGMKYCSPEHAREANLEDKRQCWHANKHIYRPIRTPHPANARTA